MEQQKIITSRDLWGDDARPRVTGGFWRGVAYGFVPTILLWWGIITLVRMVF